MVPSAVRPRSIVCWDTPRAGMSTWTGLLAGRPTGAVGAGDGDSELRGAAAVMDGPEGSPVTLGPVPVPMRSSSAPAHPASDRAAASKNGISH
jgi:hypothetical protein